MNFRKFVPIMLFIALFMAVSLLVGGSGQADAQPPQPPKGNGKGPKITHEDRKAAAARAFQEGALNPLMVDAQAAAVAQPGDAPRYFSHPNYANSPLPIVPVAVEIPIGNLLTDRELATDADPDVFVALLGSPLPAGFITSFQTMNQATDGSGQASAGLSFHAYVLRPITENIYSVVFDSGQLTVPALTKS